VRAWAHVCALADEAARLPFDTPEVQQARREALAWWIPLLGGSLVCLTTLAADLVHYGGAVTVATDRAFFADDPFAGSSPGRSSRPGCSRGCSRRPDPWSSATPASPGRAVRSRSTPAIVAI
jgi:hypothetical protein